MNRANTENFLAQADFAAIENMVAYRIYRQYEKEFPDKITIVQDCIDIKDVKHFNNWMNRP